MQVKTLEEALQNTPFRPFTIHADGREIRVQRPEQILITPNKSTAVVAGADDGLALLDLDHIGSLSVAARRRRTAS